MPFCFVHCAFLWHCSHWCVKTQPLVCLKYFCVWGIAVFICLCVFLWPCRHWCVKALSLVWKGTGTYSHCHWYSYRLSRHCHWCVQAVVCCVSLWQCRHCCIWVIGVSQVFLCLRCCHVHPSVCTSVALQTLLHLGRWCVWSISVYEVLPWISVCVYVCGSADIAVSESLVCIKYVRVWGIAVNIRVCVYLWHYRLWYVNALSLVCKGIGVYRHCHWYVNILCMKALPLMCQSSCLLCISVPFLALVCTGPAIDM